MTFWDWIWDWDCLG